MMKLTSLNEKHIKNTTIRSNNTKKPIEILIKLFLIVIILQFNQKVCAQNYSPETTPSNVEYNTPSSLPNYLVPFQDENFGNKITCIISLQNFSGDNPT